MDIIPAQLQAFLEVVKCGSISQAAKNLFVTQPAISLRLKQLESVLNANLLVRGKTGIRVTEAGHQILRYASMRKALDEELRLQFVSPPSGALRGQLQLAGHFSIINHVAIPSITPLLMENQEVMLHTIVKEDDELPPLLARGEIDFVFLQEPISKPGFEWIYLGAEEYVMIEPTKTKVREDVYIDSDPTDVITQQFFKLQRKAPKRYSRCFLHSEAGILRGVLAGVGRGVVAKNEIPPGYPVRILSQYRSLKIPAYLHYVEQPHYTHLQLRGRENLVANCRKYLSPK